MSFTKLTVFFDANSFGTIATAFNPDGCGGIFESNSIMRSVARLGSITCSLYRDDAYSASRIDSFLDATLVFACDSKLYLLSLLEGTFTSNLHETAKQALCTYLSRLNRALSPDRSCLVGDTFSIVDICVIAELALFFRERDYEKILSEFHLSPTADAEINEYYPLIADHFHKLCEHEAFAPDVLSHMEKLLLG